jgi:hypothetical protein
MHPVLVARAYNPSYSGGREQDLAWAKNSRSYLEKTHHKKRLVEWLKVVLSSRPSTTKKKKNKKYT